MEVRRPVRAAHRGEIRLEAPADRVFPYLCPVREREWVPGWDPSLVVSESGLAEDGCVFVTGEGDERAIWTYVEHRPHVLRLLKVSPATTVCDIHMEVAPTKEGAAVRISYAHTALTPAGEEFCRAWDEAAFRAFLDRFESTLAARLARPDEPIHP